MYWIGIENGTGRKIGKTARFLQGTLQISNFYAYTVECLPENEKHIGDIRYIKVDMSIWISKLCLLDFVLEVKVPSWDCQWAFEFFYSIWHICPHYMSLNEYFYHSVVQIEAILINKTEKMFAV